MGTFFIPAIAVPAVSQGGCIQDNFLTASSSSLQWLLMAQPPKQAGEAEVPWDTPKDRSAGVHRLSQKKPRAVLHCISVSEQSPGEGDAGTPSQHPPPWSQGSCTQA